MAIIEILSPHVADLIAAGEVVERPASVVKELVENSIDAGARHITVEVKNGGLTFLRVTDDGCGMSPEDAPTAFLRHATSKLRRAEDLNGIRTLGFRGEALAATAAVSRIELLTKTADAPLGTRLRLEGGRLLEQEEAGCPNGTTLVVRDLFFNTPARLKFMKRDSAEASAVVGTVQRQALSHPEVAVRCIRDGQEEFSTPGDGDLLSAIHTLFGRQFARDLAPVEGKWERCGLTGFVTKPTATRGNRNYQQFFVNGRLVRSRLMTAALEEAYRNQLLPGRFPGCVLMLSLPEEDVDVNVHPAKTEVKFLAEQAVFDCIRYGVQASLARVQDRPDVQLKAAPAREKSQPAASHGTPKEAFRTMTAEEYRIFAAALAKPTPEIRPAPTVVQEVFRERPSQKPVALENQVRLPMTPPPPAPQETPTPAPAIPAPLPPLPAERPAPPEPEAKPVPMEDFRLVGEVLNAYIIVEQGDTVLFLDKHAAHERILFEKLKTTPGEILCQTLLTPVTAGLTPEEAAAVLEETELFSRCGFQLEDFGDGCVLLRGVPGDLDAADGEAVLAQLAGALLEGRKPEPETLRDEILHTVACKAAIKAGWHTTEQELRHLAEEVLRRPELKYCPHGRPICVTLTEKELEKFFRRA